MRSWKVEELNASLEEPTVAGLFGSLQKEQRSEAFDSFIGRLELLLLLAQQNIKGHDEEIFSGRTFATLLEHELAVVEYNHVRVSARGWVLLGEFARGLGVEV